MEKHKVFSILYVAMIIALILFMIWVVIFLQGNAKQCLANPMKYYEAKNNGVYCYCMNEGELTGYQTIGEIGNG